MVYARRGTRDLRKAPAFQTSFPNIWPARPSDRRRDYHSFHDFQYLNCKCTLTVFIPLRLQTTVQMAAHLQHKTLSVNGLQIRRAIDIHFTVSFIPNLINSCFCLTSLACSCNSLRRFMLFSPSPVLSSATCCSTAKDADELLIILLKVLSFCSPSLLSLSCSPLRYPASTGSHPPFAPTSRNPPDISESQHSQHVPSSRVSSLVFGVLTLGFKMLGDLCEHDILMFCCIWNVVIGPFKPSGNICAAHFLVPLPIYQMNADESYALVS